MKNKSERSALANNADWVLLSTRGDEPVQLVRWGTVEGTVANCPLIEDAPNAVRSSVQRTSLYGHLESHDQEGDYRFSPGRFENELQRPTIGSATSTTPEREHQPAPAPAKGKPGTKK
jgi:hypothetical protein